MSQTPIAYSDSLRIGIVDFVSPDEIKVLLDIEAPDGLALNTGTPRPFPRINGYLLAPCDQGYIVGQVEWITVERSQYPKRKGMQDFGLVDLPYPLRKLSLNPLGVLSQNIDQVEDDQYEFHRGVEDFPSVGDPVVVPTQKQLRAIVESGTNRRVKIGISPLAGNAEVRVDPDRLFGRHLAVLGNTGSGKSCSVAGIIRWSLEEAKKSSVGHRPNSRFIVLDPNGEYLETFRDLGDVRVFAVEPSQGIEQLRVPIWFWNTGEWSSFTQASSKTQRPTLVQSLRTVREGSAEPMPEAKRDMRRFLRTLVAATQIEQNSGGPWKNSGGAKNFRDRLKSWKDGLRDDRSFTTGEAEANTSLIEYLSSLLQAHSADWPPVFSRQEVESLLEKLSEAHSVFGGSGSDLLPVDADIPRPFTEDQLLRSLDANAELLNVTEYTETMMVRIRTILSDTRMKPVMGTSDGLTLEKWLEEYVGGNAATNGSISVIDLSLVPAEVVHTIVAVVARMTLEALQRYRKVNHGKTLPTVLVMEEAHTFIRRYADDSDNSSSTSACCQVFEKIAREGRKFGLGLVLSSQRPSELSPTVLSQCNSYLLHRISNDRDQELVRKLVPDNLRGLLRDLPSLPSRHAVLLGWASELPVLVQMKHLPIDQRPKSDDPDFWDVWTGKVPRDVNWLAVARDWQQLSQDSPVDEGEGE